MPRVPHYPASNAPLHGMVIGKEREREGERDGGERSEVELEIIGG